MSEAVAEVAAQFEVRYPFKGNREDQVQTAVDRHELHSIAG
jgi:hypothetical protein